MGSTLGSHSNIKHTARCGLDRTTAARFKKLRHVVHSHKAKPAFLEKIEGAEFGITDTNGFLQNGRKNGLKIARRA